MQPGPKPKPVEQAKRDGTAPSRIPNPPLRSGVNPDLSLPDNFTQWQRDAWHELVELLQALDVLDKSDALTVETCAAFLGRMREARSELNRSELVEVTQRGAAVSSPFWKIEREAGIQVSRLLGELGLTPSARARLANQGQQSKSPDDMLDALLGESGRERGKRKEVLL